VTWGLICDLGEMRSPGSLCLKSDRPSGLEAGERDRPFCIVLRRKCDRPHPIILSFWSAIAHQPDFSLRSLIYYQDASSSAIASLDIKRRKSRISTKTSFASLE
jgi:hypothetical protein